jgi:alpha-1,6-mannosyltransferase
VLAEPLPPVLRPEATLTVLDISEYYSEGSGGVRTYLDAKGRFVQSVSNLRRTLVVPGARDSIADVPGDRTYRLRGPAIPFHSYRLMLATRSVARIIAHERPDIVEIGSAYVVPWAVSRARRRHPARVAWFYHSNLPRLIAPDLARAGASRAVLVRAVGAYVHQLGKLADVTLAASDFAAAELARWGVERVERVTLGVDTEHFTPARRERAAAVRATLGVEPGVPLIGFVGRLAAEKQVDMLLHAWPRVARETGAMLVIVGNGPQRARLAALAAGQRVLMLPHESDRERLADLLAALDLYVSPAPYETFGLAVCEALASGVPVVSVDHGAAAELVRASGVGALAPLGDAVALGQAIVGALVTDRVAHGARARAYVEAHHTWDVAFMSLFARYRHLLR